MSELWLKFSLPEEFLEKLISGQTVQRSLPLMLFSVKSGSDIGIEMDQWIATEEAIQPSQSWFPDFFNPIKNVPRHSINSKCLKSY